MAGSPMNTNTSSYLVRFWYEPRETDGSSPVLRGMVRNLRTGSEKLLLGPDELAEFMRHELHETPVANGTRPSERRSAGAGSV